MMGGFKGRFRVRPPPYEVITVRKNLEMRKGRRQSMKSPKFVSRYVPGV